MKIILLFFLFFVSSCATNSYQNIGRECIGPQNPQTEYYTGIQAFSQFMPPLALFLTPLAILEAEKDGNVRSNYSKFIRSKDNKYLINSLENNNTDEITIWEHKEICIIKSIKPIRTFKNNNKDCRELEWFYFKYIFYGNGKGNASTGSSSYCREPNVKNWHQVSEIIKCSSTEIGHKIIGNSCVSDKTYSFPFSLVNPYLQ